MVVLSLTMSYCVTDGDEPAKAPEAKKEVSKGFARQSMRTISGFQRSLDAILCVASELEARMNCMLAAEISRRSDLQ